MMIKVKNSVSYDTLRALQSPCKLCPRECGALRIDGELGFCGADDRVVISSHGPHHGEEPPISGISGSGTIFFSHCTMACKYCQNYPISHLHNGYTVTVSELADIFLTQQQKGCHNLNLVTPTHFTPQIVAALDIAKDKGFKIPVVHNTSGYERVEVLELLEGYIDIYLPDAKYSSNEIAKRYSSADDYVECNRKALLEMARQVGELKLDDYGIAYKGLIIRHLILPNGSAGTKDTLSWIAENIPFARISLMSQYFPAYHAIAEPVLGRRILKDEYDTAVKSLEKGGLSGWVQPI